MNRYIFSEEHRCDEDGRSCAGARCTRESGNWGEPVAEERQDQKGLNGLFLLQVAAGRNHGFQAVWSLHFASQVFGVI